MFAIQSAILSSLCDFARLDARGTNRLALVSTSWQGHANGLQVGIKSAWRSVICVGDIIAELRSLPTDFAAFSHCF
jgi:hypothetical protein